MVCLNYAPPYEAALTEVSTRKANILIAIDAAVYED
jgi:hypothetical protein